MYKDGLIRFKHIHNKITKMSKGQGNWHVWQKLLFATFLMTLFVVNAAGLFQCLSLIVNIYYRLMPSMLKNVDLLVNLGGIIFFTSGAIASDRLLSRLLSHWMFGRL